jgi:xanthine dehydrogenase small subunit
MRDYVGLLINGRETRVRGAAAFMTLAGYLRNVVRATGTKIVCEEGDCGACTVLVGRVENGELRYEPVNSCIQFVFQLDATHIVTVEGLSKNGQLNAVQQAMIEHQGAQCGYCTPGFVVAMTGLSERTANPGEADVRHGLTGNLCRCTGYEPIIKAALLANAYAAPRLAELYPSDVIAARLAVWDDEVHVRDGEREFHLPLTLDSATRFKSENPDSVIVQGATDFGVMCNKKGLSPRAMLSLARLSGLDEITRIDGILAIGGRVSLSALEDDSRDTLPELHRILTLFGSPQIRNAGTLAGNIANGSPIADTLPFLFVAGASVELASVRGTRSVGISELFIGYRKLDIRADEIIAGVLVPLPEPDETLRLYKVSKRRDLDISTFTAAIRMKIHDGRMSGVRIAYGGVAPVVLRLPKTEEYLHTHEVTEETFRAAGAVARSEISPISDMRGSAAFRSQLAENILMKFYWEEVGAREACAVSA